MASIGEDIRTFIVGSTSIATHFPAIGKLGVVEQSAIRQDAPEPRIWFQRDSEHEETDLSGAGGLIESRWNIEVHTDEDDNRFDIADAIKRRMNGYYGAFGSRKVQGVFIEDHDDDYFPRGVGSEDGLYVAALTATIWFAEHFHSVNTASFRVDLAVLLVDVNHYIVECFKSFHLRALISCIIFIIHRPSKIISLRSYLSPKTLRILASASFFTRPIDAEANPAFSMSDLIWSQT